MLAKIRPLIPILLLYNVIALLIYSFPSLLNKFKLQSDVLHGVNLLLFIISLVSLFLQLKGIKGNNPQAFVRTVLGGTMIKMLLCMIAVLIYVKTSDATFSKRSIIFSMLFYLAYLAVELGIILKQNKQRA